MSRALRARKARLRERMRAVRDAIEPGERARLGAEIEQRLLSLPEAEAAREVLGYASFGSEVPTEAILARLHAAGTRVLLPYLEDGEIRAAEVAPGEALVPSSYGPGEPPRRAPVDPGTVDLVLAPGLAFDADGRRLGYGGGAYDRLVGQLAGEAVVVGLAYGLQVVEEVPAGPSDARVHLVVTEDGVLDARHREPPAVQ